MRKEREERYFEALKNRARELEGREAEIAGLLLDIVEEGYVDERHEPVRQIRALLEERAQDEPDTMLEPLEYVVFLLAGEEVSGRVSRAIELAAEYPYSAGYMRRPFRTSDLSAHLVSVLTKISGLLWMRASDFSLEDYLSLPEYSNSRTRSFYRSSRVLPDLIAQRLDEGDERTESALREIILGENQTALLSREMISGMLMSHRPDMHELVGKLLIAARLQEGLRQSIVESMDFGTPEAFAYLLKLILDQGFVRYASVVRAAAVWSGLPLEASEERVVSKMLEKTHAALSDAALRAEWLDSRNGQEVYVALFAQAMIEENELPSQVKRIMEDGEHYRKVAAQYVLSMSRREELKYASALDLLHGEERDPELLYWMLSNYTYDYEAKWTAEHEVDEDTAWMKDDPQRRLNFRPAPGLEDKEERRRQFEAWTKLLENGPAKPIKGTSGALDFLSYRYDPADVLRKMMYLTAFDMDREWTARLIALSGRMSRDGRHDLLKFFLKHLEAEEQRNFVFEMLADKNMRNRETALKRAKGLTLSDDEMRRVEGLLKLKTGTLRQGAIALLLEQPCEALAGSLERLLGAKAELQRLAGLELLTELSSNEERSADYEALRPLAGKVEKPTPKEEQLLKKLETPERRSEYSAAKGFGLCDLNAVEPWLLESTEEPLDFQKFFSLDPKQAEGFIRGLDELVHEFRDYEYEYSYYAGAKQQALVGTDFRVMAYRSTDWVSLVLDDGCRREPELDRYPLAEKWRAYVENSGLDALQLLQLYLIVQTRDLAGTLDDHYHEFSDHYDYQKRGRMRLLDGWRGQCVANLYPLEYLRPLWKLLGKCRYEDAVCTLINVFYTDSDPQPAFEAAASAMERLLAEVPADAPDNERPVWLVLANTWLPVLRGRIHDNASVRRYLPLNVRYDEARKKLGEDDGSSIDIRLLLKAHSEGWIGDNEVYKAVLGSRRGYALRQLTANPPEELKQSEQLQTILKRMIDRLLEIELARGDLATEATPLTMVLQRIEGLDTFIRILISLGGETFVRGFIYSYSDNQTKEESLSHLLRACYPAKDDNAAKLAEKLKGTGISEQRLLEAAMYAPQWIDIMAEHLDWPGLRSAAWYFHAHINESFSAEKETVVAHYSPITPQEFNDGAFDVQWFEESYRTIGEKRFKLLYDCAKYISGGSNHRRSQLFADAVLGKLKLEDTRRQLESKRGKDRLLAYSLIPLGKNREQDLRDRYDFLQKFLQESRKFGAQRRASEGAAVRIALGNLARGAGYADATRMQWDMEAGKMDELVIYTRPSKIEDVEVALAIAAGGMPDIEVTKGGKKLKSVPSRLNKNEHIVRLKEIKSELTDQHRRFVRELEHSMEHGAIFRVSELVKLHGNPVVSPLLDHLVFKLVGAASEKPVLGYFREDERSLTDIETRQGMRLAEDAELVIAHPVDLNGSGQWHVYQRDFIDRSLHAESTGRFEAPKQPFKQIFRELYVPNADEKAAGASSSRYAGHQVQPSKTVALLRGRGWTVSYEEGLQKVDYEHNVIATLYAMADWFSPADIEAPALETIEFSDRRTRKPLKLEDVPPVLFSEIMRDVDLVVSTAHVGGVDPEASLTTIELRTAIVREALDLLGKENVRLDGNYARVAGELGEYAVHLGSGAAYKQATGALNIIPVHAGQRGRLFLPFLDEDPRTAEILSKIVLLAEDAKIKDPQILAQIRG
ncbi:DUF4132 domain-containing protein [Saccharibacillus sp. VR-M41]|uniref:DUF4132 domain-containing protein n=2 Tax=Saccharibacillus alkalitolerans TaxID=2705290 RepID=A0ABX0F2D5_9BACL|nr:DUF4132 domain-containing protein [Saccharibacillus alkalitolerans]